MFSSSISCTLAMPTEQHRAFSRILSYSLSRCSAVSCLESFRPRMRLLSSRMTAAATTGPASGPRPASSTPAINPTGSQSRRFCFRLAGKDFFDGIGGEGGGVALEQDMHVPEFLLHGAHS